MKIPACLFVSSGSNSTSSSSTPPPIPPPLPPSLNIGDCQPRLNLPILHADMNEACRVVGQIVEVLREKVDGESMTDENPTMIIIENSTTFETDAAEPHPSCEIDLLTFTSPSLSLSSSSSSSSSSANPSSPCSSIPNAPSLLDDPILCSLAPPIPPKAAPPLPPPKSAAPVLPPKSSTPVPLPPKSTTPIPDLPPLSSTPSPSPPPTSAPPLPPKSAPPLPPKGFAPAPPPPPKAMASVAAAISMDKPETCQQVQTRREAENLGDRPQWRSGHFLFHFRKTESILQIGPTCGLVALRMLCGISPLPSASPPPPPTSPSPPPPSVEELLHHAQKSGFSNQGEMFSCVKMKELVDCFMPNLKTRVVRLPDKKLILKHLLRGGTALMPYDKDRNFGPTKRDGHKAHWALLLGCVVSLPDDLIKRLDDQNSASIDLQFEASKTSMLHVLESAGPLYLDDCSFSTSASTTESAFNDAAMGTIGKLRQPSLYRTTRSDALLLREETVEGSESTSLVIDEAMDRMHDCRIVALQGKSRNLMFWEVEELLESNRQLSSYDISAVEGTLVFPDGNVTEGLCNQLVLVDPF